MKLRPTSKRQIVNADFFEVVEPHLNSIMLTGSKKMNFFDSFPKKCTKCGKVYDSIESFESQTDRLARGRDEVCYIIDNNVKIYKFRNCPSPCHSTLVTVSDDRRDVTENGRTRREAFERVFEQLVNVLEMSPEELHSVVLYLIRAVAFEGLSPEEAVQLLKQDVLNDRFEGFDDHDILYEEIQTKAG